MMKLQYQGLTDLVVQCVNLTNADVVSHSMHENDGTDDIKETIYLFQELSVVLLRGIMVFYSIDIDKAFHYQLSCCNQL